MASVFDPDLVESTTLISDDRVVEVYKVGGGTLGRHYTGMWGYYLARRGEQLAAGSDLYTGTPADHAAVAQLVLDIFDTQEH